MPRDNKTTGPEWNVFVVFFFLSSSAVWCEWNEEKLSARTRDMWQRRQAAENMFAHSIVLSAAIVSVLEILWTIPQAAWLKTRMHGCPLRAKVLKSNKYALMEFSEKGQGKEKNWRRWRPSCRVIILIIMVEFRNYFFPHEILIGRPNCCPAWIIEKTIFRWDFELRFRVFFFVFSKESTVNAKSNWVSMSIEVQSGKFDIIIIIGAREYLPRAISHLRALAHKSMEKAFSHRNRKHANTFRLFA